jgi:hypothetical protein
LKAPRWTPLLAFALLAGCQPKSAEPATTESTTPTASTGSEAPQAAPATPSLSQIPAELKHDGYSYYGLGNPKPMKMEVTVSDPGQPVRVGTQTISLKEIKDGVPIFVIERKDGLEMLGVQEIRLEKDGLYNSASTVAKIGPHDLEMPAKLTIGTKWTSRTEVDQPGQSMVNDSTFVVVRPEKVKTKAGEHDALLITSTGKGTIGGQKVTTSSKSWYVKDLGGVKTVLTTTFPKGKVQTITIQETK